MTKRNIEVDDVLPDCVETALEQVNDLLRDYIKDNSPDKIPLLGDLDYSGSVHEIVDGAVPIYTSQIEAAWFLHGSELEAAYENAGVGENPRESNGGAAIYFYIYEKVAEWYWRNAERIFEELQPE
ncbi:MAG: hypothetical protein EBR82_29025 [Caulobacteraceae bacterium]|nr:hypothetical protein [Caulobacteraceae bacterium]